jgi:hypothetical protein
MNISIRTGVCRALPLAFGVIALSCISGSRIYAQAGASAAQGSAVKLVQEGGGFHLIRDGHPFFIKGAGGDGSKALLRDLGGNSFRTWGADNAGVLLDEAQKLGITVTLGIWLGHKEHGFDYNNTDQVAEQIEQVRAAVMKYRNHPALLMWALGNEMEGDGSNAAVWSALNNLGTIVKQLDPNHPIMTVVAEIGGAKVKNINRLCPTIDVIGINSYGGGPSLAQRYRAAGGVKPYVVTEFGPAGTWEIGRNGFDAVEELTSTAKQATYAATYTGSIDKQPLCLGSYAFAWGNKQEATATWFGLMLQDGSRLGAIDTLSSLWTGKQPAYPCPKIASLKVDNDQGDPGATVHARLETESPTGDPLKVTWVLQASTQRVNTNGDTEKTPPTFAASIVSSTNQTAEIKLPSDGGIYRLFTFVHDAHGGAAVANIPILVKGAHSVSSASANTVPAKHAKLPFVVYDEAGVNGRNFIPSGYMGNTGAIKLDEKCEENPHGGKTCIKVQYLAKDNWGGVVWQDPANDWGDLPGGANVTGAGSLNFWARGEKGGEKVTFICGLIKSDKPYHDTALTQLPDVILTSGWKRYSIDLKGKDLSRIKTGFAWTLGGSGEPITFYLDDIVFE